MQKTLTPSEIVKELDKYIISQKEAKRSVAIAMRNRWRRQQVEDASLREEITPKNIIMIGPTGVGKTEIARRLARLAQSPFLKIEATKFTEVGYVGRDVESMIRDLTELAVNIVKKEEYKNVDRKARESAEERILDLLYPRSHSKKKPPEPIHEAMEDISGSQDSKIALIRGESRQEATREKIRKLFKKGKLDDRYVEVELEDRSFPMVEIFAGSGLEEMDINFKEMLGNFLPKKTKKSKLKVPEAYDMLVEEEKQRLIDMEKVIKAAVERVEHAGIIFLDEIDKIVGRDAMKGPDISREGVQRDLLPLVEGSTVTTKYGMVKTDHILFIASGAFHTSKPSDLIPELQGRFPIRVELKSLTKEDFVRILREPENALISQYEALLKTEGVKLVFEPEAIEEIASIASEVNSRTENIGARRLHTVMERLLDEVSFEAPELRGQEIRITVEYVREKLHNILKDEDLSRYIL